MMKNKRVFVSGGSGVIGMEMVPKLLELGAIVYVGDLKLRPALFPSEVKYRQGDLNTLTEDDVKAFSPDIFIHLAATFERSTESYGFWDENFWHNIRLSHHLMTILKECASLKRVVFASSYLIYSPSIYQFDVHQLQPMSLSENDPVAPRNLTGMAKLAHEIELEFLYSFCKSRFSIVAARIYRGYGKGSRDVISRWIRAALQDEPISVFRPEGIFDYIYGSDSAEGLIRLADSDVTGIINLGTGRARAVSDVVTILKSHFPTLVANVDQSDIPFEASQANMALYQSKIGWVPEYTLETALPEIIEYERMRLNRPVVDIVTRPVKILVTSASKKVPLIRAVRSAAVRIHPDSLVVAGDNRPFTLASFVADDSWIMPATNDEHLKLILEGCIQRGITAILPTRDGELFFWATHASQFLAHGIDVIVSPAESVTLSLDKWAFSQFGASLNLPFIPSSLECDETVGARYVVKERYGSGSCDLGLDLDEAAAKSHASKLKSPIFQPFLEGVEISVDAWVSRLHQVKGLVLRKRDRIVDGESQITTTFRDYKVEALVTHVLGELKLRGPVVLQALIDSVGQIHIIECNARFGGASTLGIAAGLDSLYWSMLESQCETLDDYLFRRSEKEIRQVRVLQDLYFIDPNI